jgi:hypothetical protein
MTSNRRNTYSPRDRVDTAHRYRLSPRSPESAAVVLGVAGESRSSSALPATPVRGRIVVIDLAPAGVKEFVITIFGTPGTRRRFSR